MKKCKPKTLENNNIVTQAIVFFKLNKEKEKISRISLLFTVIARKL